MKDQSTDTLTPSELARLTGVSTDTLRYYERRRVLAAAPRKLNGYRQYPASAVDRVRLIRRALAIGMSLDQVSEVLKLRDKGGSPCRRVRDLAVAKLHELEAAAREIELVSTELRAVINSWDSKLSTMRNGDQALLLESLPDLVLGPNRIIRDLAGVTKRGAGKKRKEPTDEY